MVCPGPRREAPVNRKQLLREIANLEREALALVTEANAQAASKPKPKKKKKNDEKKQRRS